MADVTQEIDISNLPQNEQDAITGIRQRNQDIMNGVIAVDLREPGPAASLGFFGIRSAHGIGWLDYTTRPGMKHKTLYAKRGDIGDLYRIDVAAKKKAKLCWLGYAESAATEHANGQIPTLVEFSGAGGGRIIFDYARDLLIYTPDHYGTYLLVTEGAGPARTF
jgi:hypothetical protein